ncbi:MAG: Elongation factor P [Candidatus Anoxychlamydiales bacterium]|nr:Elongation factor P [Candidatus Anoxychlamydiales bacterium]
MRELSTNEIRSSMKVEIDNEPYVVVSNQFVKPGKGQAFNRIRVKNLLTSRTVEKTYKSTEKLKLADVEETSMRLLYLEQDGAVFMNDETFDQITVSFSVVKDNRIWLKDDTVYDLIFYKGAVIDLIPPTFMELEITESEPGLRGDSASGRVLKPAILETGAKVQVPIFINQGEKIKVDTRTTEYVSRVS